MARPSFAPAGRDKRYMQELPRSADDLPERVMVDLDKPDEGYEIVDDTPEDDRGQPTTLDKSLADQEEDLRGLSKNVQKRIDRLRFETHTERRAREAAERERDAAIEHATAVQREAEQLRATLGNSTTALTNSLKAEREARMAEAQRKLAQAHNDGDSAAIAAATAEIATASAELTAITAQAAREKAAPAPAPAPVREAPRQAPTLAPNVAAWIAHNDAWFNKDPARTEFAMSLDKTIRARGIAPASPEYTRELDKGLKAMYPDHRPYDPSGSDDTNDGGRSTPRRTNVVADGSRETRSGDPRKVELTRSEVSLANKMRIPLAKYAEEKRRRLEAEGGA